MAALTGLRVEFILDNNIFNPSILHIYVFICKWRDILWQRILNGYVRIIGVNSK